MHAWTLDKALMEKYAQESEDSGFTKHPLVKKINSFYVYFEGSQASCMQKDTQGWIDLYEKQLKSVISIFQSIEKL